jgi:glutamate formiminotransferase / formiminotetrahydrofolate cyclodeaminase
MPLIECVPNFSEGRDPRVIDAIANAIGAAHGRVLDRSLDAWHHRAVITFVAEPHHIVNAAFAAIRTARDLIDLREHAGVHPRIGAADVVPFIPLDGTSMDECVQLARSLAERVGAELQIPAYLYEHAATHAEYRNLADVRQGGTEALAREISTTRTPDFGPHTLHPTAGAVAIGARAFLGAFNIFVGDASKLPQAKAIARDIRAASGGLPGVKALGLIVDGQAQVSMNVTDLSAVPLHMAFDAVVESARIHGVSVTHSELISLLPQRSIEAAFASRVMLRDSRDTISLEQRIAQTVPVDNLARTANAIASLNHPEASGTAAALATVLAAATVRLAAGVHVARAKGEHVASMQRVLDSTVQIEHELHVTARDDAHAWQQVIVARRLPRTTDGELAIRADSVDAALIGASNVPLRIARLALQVLALAADAATYGDDVTAPDAWTGATLAHAAVCASLGLLRGNVAMLHDAKAGIATLAEARIIVTNADALRSRAGQAVKHVAE